MTSGRGPPSGGVAAMREIIEHTADLGLRVRGSSLEALFEEAGRGFTEIIAGDLGQIRPATVRDFQIPGDDPAYLLFDWVNELLYAFDSQRMLFSAFEVRRQTGGGIRATARGERFDPARHDLTHEVKAITYHGLAVRRVDGCWEGTLIVDI